jgi:hypothetical protein
LANEGSNVKRTPNVEHSHLSEKRQGSTADIIAWLVAALTAIWLASHVMRGGGYDLIGDIVVGMDRLSVGELSPTVNGGKG